jgi:hypothetical protein
VGSILLLFGLLAGVINRNVLDGPRFAHHMDAVRRDPAVAQQIGTAITNRVLAADPDLVVARPLIEAGATALVATPVFGPVFRAAVRQVHGAFTGSGSVALRLADVGAIVAAWLPTVAPGAAARIPQNLDVTLSQVGSGTFTARTIHAARVVRLLSWLLPVLALVAFAGGWLLARDRRRRAVHTGWGIVWAGAGLGLLTLAGSLTVAALDLGGLHGALLSAAWREFSRPLWLAAAITIGAGALFVLAASGRLPQIDLHRDARRITTAVLARPQRQSIQVLRAAVFVLTGVALLLQPRLALAVLAVLAGLTLLLIGIAELARIAGAGAVGQSRTAPASGRRRGWLLGAGLGVALAVVIALVVVDAEPSDQQISTAAANGLACDGFAQLCDRPYNEVAFAGTHNSMAAADEGWFAPEQPDGVIAQLNHGIRVLLIDSWYGQATTRPGFVATAAGGYEAAVEEARAEFGSAAVDSFLRLHKAIGARKGPVRPYLCHGPCEMGATEWEPLMVRVRSWLVAHPREVVTFFIEDEVTPADTAKVFRQAGLLPYVYTPSADGTWPTLGQMIDSGHRLVVEMERQGGGSTYPWLMQGFHWVQDNPFGSFSKADLSCAPNRGLPSSPILLINYWLTNDYRTLVTDSRKINPYAVLWPFVARCQQERGMLPNYVAVNFYNEGDVFRVVDQLNGVN